MRLFFQDMDILHQFTLQLDSHRDAVQCQHCAKCDQFVSHGFVHKKQHNGDKQPVGKRLLCSNRYGRSGCGHTLRLYLAVDIPAWHYSSVHLLGFVQALIGGLGIQQAYQQSTGTAEPRHAYRWLNKLDGRLPLWRALLNRRPKAVCGDEGLASRTRRLRLLLPTLQALFVRFGTPLGERYQLDRQSAFI